MVRYHRTHQLQMNHIMYHTQNIRTTLFLWLVVNLFLPMLTPAIILYAYALTQGNGDGLWTIIEKLKDCGMFVFSAFTLTYSLFEDYDTAKRVVNPIHYCMIFIAVIFLIFMFLQTNPLFEFYHETELSELSWLYWSIFTLLVVLNTYLKFRILNNARI